jgi:NAD(P)-dependent dehydrogenase (short-subunit alcohol dehydrogenase family)
VGWLKRCLLPFGVGFRTNSQLAGVLLQRGSSGVTELFDEATKGAFESLIPRGKMGRPEEIATMALFLASDDSSYVNGLELVTDGGTTAI